MFTNSVQYYKYRRTMSLEVDALDIKETLLQRVNDAMSDFKSDAAKMPDLKGMDKFMSTLLPPLVTALATSVAVAVGEVLAKAVRQIDTHQSERKCDTRVLANLRVLTYENDRLHQYSRRENVRIFGVPVDPSETAETTEKKTLAVLLDTGVDIDKEDISACHRLGKTSNGTRPIIVRFVSRRKRAEVLRKKKTLRDSRRKIFY